MRTWFSSDWHLGHANIIKYDNRPFKNTDEMDHKIIGNITRQVSPGDDLYYLGDFALTRSDNTMEGYMKALVLTGANLFFIKGNHDKKDTIKLYQKYGTYLGEQKKIRFPDDSEAVLNHFAMRVWDKSHRGVYHFYGHSHDALEKEPWGKSCDVSVVTAYRIKGEYELFDYEELRKILDKRVVKVIDHHGKTDRE